MKRDKARDDEFFSCQAEHEINYVAGLYPEKQKVKQFLLEMCEEGVIKYMTHADLYKLIEKGLGYPIPH